MDPGNERDLLRATTRRFLESEFPVSRVRALADDRGSLDRELWRRGAELGWTAMLIPEELGGGAISAEPVVDLTIVAEEMGRLVQPWPLLSTNVVAAALAASGSDEHAKVLSGIASGDTLATLALVDEDGWRGADVTLAVDRSDGAYRLNGSKVWVDDADAADHLLVVGRDGGRLLQLLVPTGVPGVTVEPMAGLDFARRRCRVTFDDVEVPATALVVDGDDAVASIEWQLQLAFVLQCAESVGGAQRVCELTFQYAKDRYAFGRPIGSFQAVKHLCAGMLVLLEGSKAATAAAAAALQAGAPDAAALASIASAHVGEAFSKIARDAVQVHGGIGYTWEHDAHLFLRRAKANELLLGDPAWHREHLCRLAGL